MSSTSPFQSVLIVHQNPALQAHEKDANFESIIFPQDRKKDLVAFLLDNLTSSDELNTKVFEAIEKYSSLFMDIVQSDRFLLFIDWLKTNNKNDRICSASISMMKISWKLNSSHQSIPETHLSAMIDFGLTCIASESQGLAEQSSRMVEQMIKQSPKSEYFMLLKQQALLHESKKDGVTVFRYLSLAEELAKENEATAQQLIDLEISQIHFQLCRGSDMLLQITAMDLLPKFATTITGLNELIEKGIFDWLIVTSCGSETERPDPLLESEALRTLGLLFVQASQIQSNQFLTKISHASVESFLNSIGRRIEDGDEATKISSLAILSEFTMISSQTLFLIENQNNRLLQLWLKMLNSSKTEISSAALAALVKVFDQPDDHYVNNSLGDAVESEAVKSESKEGDTITGAGAHKVFKLNTAAVNIPEELSKVMNAKKHIYQMIGEAKGVSTLQYLLKSATSPIPPLRNAAMDLIRSIASQTGGSSGGTGGGNSAWGILALFGGQVSGTNSDFWKYVKNRTTEFSKEGKDFKFAIIKAIYHSPAYPLLGEDIQKEIKKMIDQGAYYMPPRMEELETI